ncbi:hypothetical protein [uncultured Thiothrix sp.]|uniref:hypothetical protein n=1 Tax=uncultured Thiothrix sp. TaxID=223185 RepID=UPI0026119DF3|nr:hypothetical protein [uncultured Thiothrix sp.]
MSSVQITTQVSTEQLLHGVASLPAAELDQFVAKVLALRAKLRAPSLSEQEAQLLKQINQGLATQQLQRFTELDHKRQDETLSELEHQELLALIAQMEQLNAVRIQSLAQLAMLRQVSLTTLMNNLGIKAPDYA